MTNKLTQGKQIRIMRTVRGLNQGELAEKIGMAQVTLSYIENDHVAPTPERMEMIKAVLSWPPDDQAEAAFAILARDGSKS
jgi:transcriptional regulator with XRE-family HTH domain